MERNWLGYGLHMCIATLEGEGLPGLEQVQAVVVSHIPSETSEIREGLIRFIVKERLPDIALIYFMANFEGLSEAGLFRLPQSDAEQAELARRDADHRLPCWVNTVTGQELGIPVE